MTRNKKTDKLIETLIELRAQGLTFKQVAEKMNISAYTLIQWGKPHKEEIERRSPFEAAFEDFELEIQTDKAGDNRISGFITKKGGRKQCQSE